jgi:hypothetical protein
VAKSTRSRPDGLAGAIEYALDARTAQMLPQSQSYQRCMRLFVVVIAMLLGVASVSGAATANAHRYVSTPIVVLNHVDQDNRPIPVFVQVQRGQIDLGAGLMMPCGPHHAIAAHAPQMPCADTTETLQAQLAVFDTDWQAILPLRPPIGA